MKTVHIQLSAVTRRLRRVLLCAGIFTAFSANAQQVPGNFRNPVLPGFYPDPSVCRVGDDYYLVNSSFEWFPGLPVHHSRDLVNWELIGYGITRPGQVDLPEGLGDSRGVFAPTIRYHDGLFYIINTCVDCNGNFYITATNPAGPWSDPVWLHSPGIDPSLFWDDDGRCYYVGHGNLTGEQDWPDQQGAWMQELDLAQQKLVGRRSQLTHGHASNAVWAEGPHLYKINGTYMLLVAEGGTDFHHSVTMHHSDSLWGPYIPYHVNPVLTHRHLGKEYPLYAVGHADLVKTQRGEWWSVMLGKRRMDGYTLLARETFMTPVTFEDQDGMPTPVFNPGVGRLSLEQERPDLPWTPVEPSPSRDEFNGEQLSLHWNFLRTPFEKWYRLADGTLEIDVRPETAERFENPSLIARRICHHAWHVATEMDFSPSVEHQQAGLIIYRRSTHHFKLVRETDALVLIRTLDGNPEELARVPWEEDRVVLSAEAKGAGIVFMAGPSENALRQIGDVQSLSVISDELAGGFNGPYAGMYATGNGHTDGGVASFSWFEYKEK